MDELIEFILWVAGLCAFIGTVAMIAAYLLNRFNTLSRWFWQVGGWVLGGCWHRGSKRCSAFNTFSHSIVLHRRKQAMMKRMIRMLTSINNRPTLALG